MSFNTHNFEVRYGFDMLDTMHNFFPELMYDETLFSNPTLNWMRMRTETLFPAIYVRQRSMYNLYQAETRRANFEDYTTESLIQPITHSSRPTVLLNTTPISVTLSPTTTSTAPISPAATTRAVTPVRIAARTSSRNPLSSNINLITLSEPIRTPRTTGLTASVGPVPLPVRRTRVNTLLDDPMATLLDTFLTNALTNVNGFHTANLNFEDVHVAPTAEEIRAGSTILEHSLVAADVNCSVCQEHGVTGIWRKLYCNHLFHKSCIDPWFAQNVNCPQCRADIRDACREETVDDETDSLS